MDITEERELREKQQQYLAKLAFGYMVGHGKTWDVFLTVTFKRPRKDPYYALKAVVTTLKALDVFRSAFLVAEYHLSGNVHIHGVAQWQSWFGKGVMRAVSEQADWESTYRSAVWGMLFKSHGRSSVEPIRSPAAIEKYIAKYCAKDLTDHYIYGIFELQNKDSSVVGE